MRIIPYAMKGAFLLGILTTGAAVGFLIKKNKILTELKKSQFKENKSASSK